MGCSRIVKQLNAGIKIDFVFYSAVFKVSSTRAVSSQKRLRMDGHDL
jgi:endonuclease/exonuclease/phosphatase family metal-dependent hydrolase